MTEGGAIACDRWPMNLPRVEANLVASKLWVSCKRVLGSLIPVRYKGALRHWIRRPTVVIRVLNVEPVAIE